MKPRKIALSLACIVSLAGASIVIIHDFPNVKANAEIIGSTYEYIDHSITINKDNPLLATNMPERFAMPLDNGVYANFYTSGSDAFCNDPSGFPSDYSDYAFSLTGYGKFFQLNIEGYTTPNTYRVNGEYTHLYGFDALYIYELVYANPSNVTLQNTCTFVTKSETEDNGVYTRRGEYFKTTNDAETLSFSIQSSEPSDAVIYVKSFMVTYACSLIDY